MYKMLFAPQGEKLHVNCCFRLTLVLHAYVHQLSEIFLNFHTAGKEILHLMKI